ncbi:MAG: hypothetical protein NXI07_15460, partial [bacterium]|nr:hypothetical protein [bacterium]
MLTATGNSCNFDKVEAALRVLYPEGTRAPAILSDGRSPPEARHERKPFTGRPSSASSSLPAPRPQRTFKTDTVPEGDETVLVDVDEGEEEAEDPAAASDDQAQDTGADQDGADTIQELHEVLTVTAQKLKGLALSRGYKGKGDGRAPTPGSKTRSIAEKKRTSACSACGAIGHWANDDECPLKGIVASSSASSAPPPPAPHPKGGSRRDRETGGKRPLRHVKLAGIHPGGHRTEPRAGRQRLHGIASARHPSEHCHHALLPHAA